MNPLPAEERVAVFGPSKIHYRVHGPRSELPEIVLDHGGGGSADDWNLVVPLLAARGRVISYDRAGMGNSPSDGLGCGECACQRWQWHKFDFERHELRDLGPEPDRVARSCVLIHRMDIADDDHVRFTTRRVDNRKRDHQPGGGDEGWTFHPQHGR